MMDTETADSFSHRLLITLLWLSISWKHSEIYPAAELCAVHRPSPSVWHSFVSSLFSHFPKPRLTPGYRSSNPKSQLMSVWCPVLPVPYENENEICKKISNISVETWAAQSTVLWGQVMLARTVFKMAVSVSPSHMYSIFGATDRRVPPGVPILRQCRTSGTALAPGKAANCSLPLGKRNTAVSVSCDHRLCRFGVGVRAEL